MNFRQEFLNKYGRDLESILPNGDDEQNKVNRFAKEQIEMLETYCQSMNISFSYDNLSQTKKDVFDAIVIDQMAWVLSTDNYSLISGLDIATGVTIPLEELEKRYVSPTVQMKLKAKGFCFRGFY